MIASTTRLNRVGTELAELDAVHALTDVTGFGLLGHALEMARGSGLAVEIDAASVPVLTGVEALVRAGIRTGASDRNWASYGEAVSLPGDLPDWRRDLLTDPQTSGGLLVSVSADAADDVLATIRAAGFNQAAIVGRAASGTGVRVA